MEETTEPTQKDSAFLYVLKQEEMEHWTVDEMLQYSKRWTEEELSTPALTALLDEDPVELEELMQLCTSPNLDQSCPPCVAYYLLHGEGEQEPLAGDNMGEVTRAPDPTLAAIAQASTEYVSSAQAPDPKQNVLDAAERLRETLLVLFDTGQSYGPVDRDELALLVWAANKYIETSTKLWESGFATPSETQREQISEIAKIVNRVGS